jgi:multiple sugar transport system permease protein
MRTTRREKLASLGFLLPSLLGLLVFFIAPFAQIIRYALVNNPVANEFVGIENFTTLLHNHAFKLAARNTLRFSFVALPLSVILSLLLATALETKIPGKSRFRTFFLSPMLVPIASIVLVWRVVFDYNGSINSLLQLFGGAPIDWLKSGYSLFVIVLLFLWKTLGYNMILFTAALANVPKSLLEAAAVDGVSPARRFFTIKLRSISPAIFSVTILSLISSFKVFREVYLLTGNYPYDLYMIQHFMNNTFRSLDYQKLSAAALVMAAVIAVIIGAMFIIESRFGRDMEQ